MQVIGVRAVHVRRGRGRFRQLEKTGTQRARADFVVDTSQGFDHARAQVREILTRVGKMDKRTQ